jgi:hypothetical protein
VSTTTTIKPPPCPGVGWIKVCVRSRPKEGASGVRVLSEEAMSKLLEAALLAADVKCPGNCKTTLLAVKTEGAADKLCRVYAVQCTVPGGEPPEIPPIPDRFLYNVGPRTGRRGSGTLFQGGWLPTWELSRLLGGNSEGLRDESRTSEPASIDLASVGPASERRRPDSLDATWPRGGTVPG